jgi:YHS domain-containing protein
MANVLRKWWVWPILLVIIVSIVFTLLPGGSSAVDRPLTEFVEDANAGRVRSVEVDGRDIEYKLIGDEQTFSAEMERYDTVREVLQDAGVDPQDFPPIKIEKRSFWVIVPSLILQILPVILFVGILYFIVRRATGGGAGAAKGNDPVCGKRVGSGDAAGSSSFQDISYRFCSSECKQMFDANPVRYLLKT